jgi:predicted nucleic acid-binding Zn ribbon protein
MAEFTEKIPQHRHCAGCGKAFVGEGRFCSEGCQAESAKEVKGKLKKLVLIWVAIVVVTVILVVAVGI